MKTALLQTSAPLANHLEDSGRETMRAIHYDSYGAFAGLSTKDVPMPVIKDTEVLVHVEAAGLHVADCFGVLGAPFVMRFALGLLRPKVGIPGYDLAGRVERVGAKVTKFRPGDEVFGSSVHGTCASFARSDEDTLVHKPANLSLEQAAAIPTSALAALHGLRDAGKLQSGQKVLINGASGGVGTFAVQIAKSLGADVTGVCSTANLDLVRSLGADHVIDYTQEDFTEREGHYDLVFDNVENRSLSDIRRAATPTGTIVFNSGTGAKGFAMFARLIKPIALSPFTSQNLRRYLSTPNQEDLVVLKKLLESERLRPVIDRSYPLGETADALRYIAKGHTRGKVVIAL